MERLSKWSSCEKSVHIGGLLHLVLPVNLKFYCFFSFPESLLCAEETHRYGMNLGTWAQVFVGKKLKNNWVTKMLREGLRLTGCSFLRFIDLASLAPTAS